MSPLKALLHKGQFNLGLIRQIDNETGRPIPASDAITNTLDEVELFRQMDILPIYTDYAIPIQEKTLAGSQSRQ